MVRLKERFYLDVGYFSLITEQKVFHEVVTGLIPKKMDKMESFTILESFATVYHSFHMSTTRIRSQMK